MSVHLSYIAGVVTRSYDSILNEINASNGKYISNNAYNLGNHITSVVEETTVINGKELVIRRVFVHSADSGGYETVGWVLSGDVKHCMICSTSFGYFTYQHYCIACGNIVCQKCSSNEALIFEIEQLGPKRVCDQCFWGQEMVYCLHRSAISTPAQTPLKAPPMITPRKASFTSPAAGTSVVHYAGSVEQVKDLHHRIDKIHSTMASSAKKEYTSFSGYASAVISPGDVKSDYDSDENNEYLNNSIDAYTTRLQHSEDTYHQYLATTAGAVYSPNAPANINNHNDLSYSAIPEISRSRSRSRSDSGSITGSLVGSVLSGGTGVGGVGVKHAPVMHLEFIQAVVHKSADVVEHEHHLYEVLDRAAHQDEPYIETLLREQITQHNSTVEARRVFVHCVDSGSYSAVGWQLLCDVAYCMVCSQHFNTFVHPRHCFACGNVVCAACSPDEGLVHELENLGPQRVCVQCHWGQEVVFGQYRKPADMSPPACDSRPRILSDGIASIPEEPDREARELAVDSLSDPNSLESILKELSVKNMSESSSVPAGQTPSKVSFAEDLAVTSGESDKSSSGGGSPSPLKNQSSASTYNKHFDATDRSNSPNRGGAEISHESIPVKNAIKKYTDIAKHNGAGGANSSSNGSNHVKIPPRISPPSTTGAASTGFTPPTTPTRKGEPVPKPAQLQGWLRKRGHVVLNWKSRYFVLDNGYLTYYVDKADTPPFGKEMKGQLCLAGYRDAEVVGANHDWSEVPTVTTASGKKRVLQRKVSFSSTSAGNGSGSNWSKQVIETPAAESAEYDLRKLCTIHLASNTNGMVLSEEAATSTMSISESGRNSESGHELLLEAASVEEKVNWLAALNAHILYIEDVLQRENAANILLTPSMGMDAATSGRSASATATAAASGAGGVDDKPDSPAKVIIPSGKVSGVINNYAGGGTGNFYKKQLSSVEVGSPEQPAAERTNSGSGRSTLQTRRLQIFLKDGETLLYSGIVTKPNPMGVQLMRELLWTSGHRLIYIDPKTLEVKGEVSWSTREPHPRIRLIDATAFEVIDCRQKVYRFLPKDELTAQDWVAALENAL